MGASVAVEGSYSLVCGFNTKTFLPSFLKKPALVFWPKRPSEIKDASTSGTLNNAANGSCFRPFSIVRITLARVSSPTTSLVRKVADFARPSLLPVRASTTSKPSLYVSASAKTARIANTPTRLPTKLGVSFARTTPLPMVEVINVSSWSKIKGSVAGKGINSSKCM